MGFERVSRIKSNYGSIELNSFVESLISSTINNYYLHKMPFTMLRTTTSVVEGRQVKDYLDIVVGEAILGANVFKDMFGAIRDIVGGRSGAYEKEMARARKIAFEEMESKARSLGADGIIGIDIDYEVVGQGGSMMMVSVSGTAVTLQR